jgi:hemolysin activation/secretion protein
LIGDISLSAAQSWIVTAFVTTLFLAATSSAQPVPQGSPLPRALPVAPLVAPVPVAKPVPAQIQVAAPDQQYPIAEIAIEGATVYPVPVLDRFFASLGANPTGAALGEAAQALLDRYRADGYIFTTVTPGYDAARRRLTIRVVEAYIAELKLDGDIGPAAEQVHRFLDHLVQSGPINQATLERWLLLTQDMPGISVHAVLQPSDTEPGALTLVAKLARKPFDFLLSASNRGAPTLGPEGALLVVAANSFTRFGERTEISLLRSINGTQVFGQAASEFYLGGSGLKLRLQAGSGTTDPSGSLRVLGYHAVTTTAGLALSYPVIRSRQQSWAVGMTLDMLETHTVNQAVGPALVGRDNLRVVRLLSDYSRTDTWLGDARPAANSFALRLSQGAPVLGGTRNGDPLAARAGERVGFTKIGFEAIRNQSLWHFGEASSLALQTTLAGQFSRDVLPPAEKYFLGGDRLARGYYAGEVTGDTALAAAVELQVNSSWTTGLLGGQHTIGIQYFTFFDWGETWENQAVDANHRLASFGLGVRLFPWSGTQLDIEAIDRTVRYPLGRSNGAAAVRAQAIYWRVLTRF